MTGPDETMEPTAAEHLAGMTEYMQEGKRNALALGNRGPLRFGDDGLLHPDILESYWRHGFYVFEGVIDTAELLELRDGIDNMLERAPTGPGAEVDSRGRRALGLEFQRDTYIWVPPLSDPVGGTTLNGGRHPVKMAEPVAPENAPAEVIYMMFGMCQVMDSGLRLYGHPQLLAVAESINGSDFTPFNDAIFVKQPGLGGSVAWHQDGLTHWASPRWDEGIHGFNFQVQLYPSTPGNCLWVVPGTHKLGKVDIAALVEDNGGSERLTEAIPLFCAAGDVTITNRQALHCSFANTSKDPRVSLTFGFHRRSSVLGAAGVLGSGKGVIFDETRIRERSSIIAVAIDARQQHYPSETRYLYQPFAGLEDEFRWNEHTRETVLKDYNLKDLGI
ncbi:MAG: phytanoyl-CoA dioxygenase family protein [Gammaproteobacteria bacterium]|nr:phytanoyl-CoA dioxygenase family protein [Gammaproteobacteria bacterium]